jgi:hypothetical protein
VIYETQSPFVVLERSRNRGLLKAAVDIAQCSFGLHVHGPGSTGFVELHAEHASSGRPVDPADQPAAGFVWHYDAATG